MSPKPEIEHIHDLEWEKRNWNNGKHKTISAQSRLTILSKEEPEIETWMNQEYTEQDIDEDIRTLANMKGRGSDGISGEAYKATRNGKPTQ